MKGHGSWSTITNLIGIIIGVLLFYHGWGGNELNSLFVLILGIVMTILGIVGLVR